VTGEPLALSSAVSSLGLADITDATYQIGGAHLAAAQIFALVVGVLPASALAAVAGATLGIAAGFVLSSATLFVGAVITFLLSRSLFRPFVERWLSKRVRVASLDAALCRHGWRIVCLIRLSPVAPFTATSYLLGLSKVSLRDYLLGTLASLPALFGYVVMGDLTARGVRSAVAENWMAGGILLAGVAATALLTAMIGRTLADVLKTSTLASETLPDSRGKPRPVPGAGMTMARRWPFPLPRRKPQFHLRGNSEIKIEQGEDLPPVVK
jgi:uncharacterized membrane protein YdjX (TVP38/TMEM64 family)